MSDYLRDVWDVFLRYRHLLNNLVKRDITVKYRRSVLGLVWSVLNPLLMMLIMTAVFSKMFDQDPATFTVYLLSGQLVFAFFSEATQLGMDSVLGNATLLKKVYVPKYIFPLEKTFFSLINTLFSLIALVLVAFVVRLPLTPWALVSLSTFVLLFFFNLGVGTLLASLVIFFRDIKHLYGVAVLALTYLTPIFYPVEELGATMQKVLKLNPLYWYVSMFRAMVLEGRAPTSTMVLMCTGWAVFAMILGFSVMKKTQDRFILYI